MLYFTYRSDFRILATWLSTATTEARLEPGSCLFGIWSEHLDPRILNVTVNLAVDTHRALTQPQPHFGRLQVARTLGRPSHILELVLLDRPVLFCVTHCIHYKCRPWEQSETGNRIIVVLLQVISLISPISHKHISLHVTPNGIKDTYTIMLCKWGIYPIFQCWLVYLRPIRLFQMYIILQCQVNWTNYWWGLKHGWNSEKLHTRVIKLRENWEKI